MYSGYIVYIISLRLHNFNPLKNKCFFDVTRLAWERNDFLIGGTYNNKSLCIYMFFIDVVILYSSWIFGADYPGD